MADPNNQQQSGRLANFARGAMGPGGSGWLNNTVAIGDNNVSMATLILALVVISLAFGTGWIAVLVDPLVMGAMIVVIAVIVGYQNRGTRLFDWIAMGVVFFIGFTFTLWFLTDYLPQSILNTKQKVETGAWSQVLDDASSISPSARQDAPLGDLANSLLGNVTPDYSFDDTPGAETPALSTPVPVQNNDPGGTAIPQTTPLPTATPDRVIPLLNDLNMAVSVHDRVAAKTAAQAIQRIEPNNPQAAAALAEIAAAEATLINKRAMPTVPTWTMQGGEEGRVLRALQGGSYLVIQEHYKPRQIALACEKIATIEETDGWLRGEQYQVKWCLLDQFGIKSAGEQFTVAGE